MAGTARSNYPGGLSPAVLGGQPPVVDGRASFGKVRRLQRRLWADDGVVLCRSKARAQAALGAVRDILAALGLELHPGKTKVVDLRQGREGLDFLGCHFHARMSGRLWEQQRIIRYYLHRWPSQQATKRLRGKVRERTGSNRTGVKDIHDVIAGLNPILRGWGNT